MNTCAQPHGPNPGPNPGLRHARETPADGPLHPRAGHPRPPRSVAPSFRFPPVALLLPAVCVFALLLFSGPAFALRTSELELGNAGVYDQTVTIRRDTAGRMVFRDAEVTTPTSLWAIHGKAMSHASLSGLAADDHPHYLNAERHDAAHSAARNAVLPIPPDPDGRATLGGHVTNPDIHLRRHGAETVTGAWRFVGPLAVEGTMTLAPHATLHGVERHKANLVTVAESGADHTTIAAALAAAAENATTNTPVTILVFPGVYEEEKLEVPNWTNLVGVDRDTCIIRKTGTHYDGLTANSTALVFLPYNSTLANLTVHNTRTGFPGYAMAVAVAAVLDSGNGYSASTTGFRQNVLGCRLISDGHFAVSWIGRSSGMMENTSVSASRYSMAVYSRAGYIKRFKNVFSEALHPDADGSVAPLWVNGDGVLIFDHCRFHSARPGRGCIYVDEDGTYGLDMNFVGCAFTVGDEKTAGPIIDSMKPGETRTATLRIARTLYSTLLSGFADGETRIQFATEGMGDAPVTFGADVGVSGDLVTSGSASIGAGLSAGWASFRSVVEIGDDSDPTCEHPVVGFFTFSDGTSRYARFTPEFRRLEFSGDGNAWDVYLSRPEAGMLQTEAAFQAGSFRIGGDEIVSSGRVGRFASVAVAGTERISSDGDTLFRDNTATTHTATATRWRYLDATTHAQGDRVAESVWTHFATGWFRPSGEAFLVSALDGETLFFPVPYESGTVISKLRVRFEGEELSDGVAVSLQKRQGGTVGAPWSVVGATQNYTGDTDTVATYTLPTPETLADGYAYRIVVESVVGVSRSTRLWEVGIETTARSF